MTITSIERRVRSAMALCAGAALLGLSACGTDAETPPESPAGAAETSAEAGGGETSDGGGEQDQQPSEGGSASARGGEEEGSGAGADEGAGEDGGEMGASEGRTRIMLMTDLGTDDSSGEGAPVLSNDDLAALLAEPFGGTAECADELVLESGAASVGCVGPASYDDTAPTEEWVANVIFVPSDGGFQNGSRVAVLFSTGTELPAAAAGVLDENVSVTGVGFGSVFGMNPLTAEDVAESSLQTLTSEHAYVPVNEQAEWSEVTCEDGLDFTSFETVDCEATTADGTTWELLVAPGTYANNDQGLLVGISVPRNG